MGSQIKRVFGLEQYFVRLKKQKWVVFGKKDDNISTKTIFVRSFGKAYLLSFWNTSQFMKIAQKKKKKSRQQVACSRNISSLHSKRFRIGFPYFWQRKNLFPSPLSTFCSRTNFLRCQKYRKPPQKHLLRWLYMYIIDQARGQDGWILAEFSLCVFMDRDDAEVHKDAKRELGQHPAILTELAWSIKDLLYGTERMFFVLVYFRALKRKPVICKSDNAFRFSRSLVPSRQKIAENLFTATENILRKKTFVHPLGLRRNVIAATKRAISSEQYRSILAARVANHSARFGSSCPLAELYYKASSGSGQYAANSVFWLATRAGKMERYCPPGITPFVPTNKISPKFKRVRESFLSQNIFRDSVTVKRFSVIYLSGWN